MILFTYFCVDFIKNGGLKREYISPQYKCKVFYHELTENDENVSVRLQL